MTPSSDTGLSTTSQPPAPFHQIARNTASDSDNKIHDDAEARRFGYRAALVPGVTLYAYLTRLVVPYFGVEWLARGAASLRLLRPVYEGETVVCSAAVRDAAQGPVLDLTCAREDGTVCAEVSDDGRGAAVPTGAAGSGLSGLAERVAEAGGRMVAGPGDGGGFRLRVVLPLADETGPATVADGAGVDGAGRR